MNPEYEERIREGRRRKRIKIREKAKTMKTTKKLETFADRFKRCQISSISGYEQMDNAKIQVHLKSGDSMLFDFGVEYLSDIAFADLDKQFKMLAPQHDPCAICINKDVIDPNEDGILTFCEFCDEPDYGDFKVAGEDEDDDS